MYTWRFLLRRKKTLWFFLVTLFSVLYFLSFVYVYAEVFSSANFQVLDPIIDSSGGRSISETYSLFQSIGQLGLGTSTATNFQLNPGFFTFPTTTVPTVTATAGDGQVSLSWTAASGFLGWTVSGYNIGRATSSGGPYTYTSVGNVTSSTRTGLTNGTAYFFVVRPEDAFGNSIATSSEVSATPQAAEEEPAPSPAPSGGGGGGGGISGGGGGGASATITGSIILQGRAYPNSSVNVLLNGVSVQKVSTGATGSAFGITIPATSGSHSVGIFAVDSAGRQSLTFTFSVVVIGSAPTTVSGILLPPTLDVRAEEARPRDLIVSGSSQPSALVVLTFNSEHEIIRNTAAGLNGIWGHTLDTTILDEGDHLVRTQAFLPDKSQTIFSESRTFTVLPAGILIAKKVVSTCGVADFNCDGRVNLIDFSILLFNWGIPSNAKTDLSKDGKVNITDFSIMLFHWTG